MCKKLQLSHCSVKNYDWGQVGHEKPYAEWMGTNDLGRLAMSWVRVRV